MGRTKDKIYHGYYTLDRTVLVDWAAANNRLLAYANKDLMENIKKGSEHIVDADGLLKSIEWIPTEIVNSEDHKTPGNHLIHCSCIILTYKQPK